MGHDDGRDSGFQTEGAVPADAGSVPEGDHAGQTRDEEHVRVSGVQNPNARPHVHLDVQSEDSRQTDQVDSGRRRDSPADLKPHTLFFPSTPAHDVHTRFRARNDFFFFFSFFIPFLARGLKS